MKSETIQTLTLKDISSVLEVQKDAYRSELIEVGETFQKKIRLFSPGCLGFFEGSTLLGYVFSQPWYGYQVIPLDADITRISALPDCYYIHDLAVRKTARSRGVGRRLVESLLPVAESLGIQRFMLVAVQGSESFWETWGFVPGRAFEYTGGVKATQMELQRQAPFVVAQAIESDVNPVFSLGMTEPSFKVSDSIRFYERTELLEWVKHPGENILLVSRPVGGPQIVGFLFCKVISHHWAILDNFFVREEFRNRGCGKQLLVSLSARLRERGIEYLSTLADVSNTRLLEMLPRFGLTQQKTYGWFDAALKQ